MKRTAAAVSAAVVTLALAAAPGSASAAGAPCLVPGPGNTVCAGYVTFSSYVLSAGFRPFQGFPGSTVQPDLIVTFSAPYVQALRVWANDPDYPGSDVSVWIDGGSGWLQMDTITGDGAPGVFSVDGGDPIGVAPFTKVRLHSNQSDYLNWRVEYQRIPNGAAQWCKITAQTINCDGVTATVSPFSQGSGFDPFQAVSGTGAQPPTEITFGSPLFAVAATAVDPDYSGTRMVAYAADGSQLGTVFFDGDNRPGYTTTSTKSFSDSRGIKRVVLIPAASDYVVFQGVTATPL